MVVPSVLSAVCSPEKTNDERFWTGTAARTHLHPFQPCSGSATNNLSQPSTPSPELEHLVRVIQGRQHSLQSDETVAVTQQLLDFRPVNCAVGPKADPAMP